ncbi:hypothetical protein TCAL_00874 [Tigriopus californicus]|uniref:Uncharacterized protein n=1 Tax=Tigriopus californicus TaxID=6832 RepID=A0A553NBF3_TIGCA|nr:uncharacterized protein LOC131889583 [Tigriopus californicus]TRY62709.1 hypothetical protein TCAL_00874 [Tigriopus californicus]|eukprot:TCALIF_00874-PA protein Name:"Protein of unknown function" AED:0.00 eAED:0.00 QI:181/1/1/1/1/1/3/25/456
MAENPDLSATLTAIQQVLAQHTKLLGEVVSITGHRNQEVAQPSEPPRDALEKACQALAKGQTSLQSKLDTVVRQLDSVSDAQKAMQRTLQQVVKAQSTGARGPSPLESNGQSSTPLSGPSHATVSGVANSWAHNLFLLGDEVWMSLHSAPEVQAEIRDLGPSQNLRINCRKGESLVRLYDRQRRKILFALPPRTSHVALSIGSADLLSGDLLTLQEASLEEVRRRNEPKLRDLARHALELATGLVGQRKSVSILLPPQGSHRIEIFKHWEDILLREVDNLKEPRLTILNLPVVMRATLTDFPSHADFIQAWFRNPQANLLSDFGARRLFDLLKRTCSPGSVPTVMANNRRKSETSVECLRCLRHHIGGEGACQSKERVCRRCGEMGHFADVHDVTDETLQERITEVIAINLFPVTRVGSKRGGDGLTNLSAGKRLKPDEDVRPWQACSRILDDWYQ